MVATIRYEGMRPGERVRLLHALFFFGWNAAYAMGWDNGSKGEGNEALAWFGLAGTIVSRFVMGTDYRRDSVPPIATIARPALTAPDRRGYA